MTYTPLAWDILYIYIDILLYDMVQDTHVLYHDNSLTLHLMYYVVLTQKWQLIYPGANPP